MSSTTTAELACFGYLASAQICAVETYPAANSGAPIVQIFPSLAGDAPNTALTARGLGVRVHLVSNRVSIDGAGQTVLDTLDTAGVNHQAVPLAARGFGTPQLTIVTDDAGTRTWFAWLGNAADELTTADMTALATARMAYIDCYRIIDTAAAVAITASRGPLLLNLGGDPLSPAVKRAAANRRVTFVQTNLDEHLADQADRTAADLLSSLDAETVVVTVGRLGAVGYTSSGRFDVRAEQVTARHTCGAGAAFSAGLAHAHLSGATAHQAVQAACVVGTAHCAGTAGLPMQRDPHINPRPGHSWPDFWSASATSSSGTATEATADQ